MLLLYLPLAEHKVLLKKKNPFLLVRLNNTCSNNWGQQDWTSGWRETSLLTSGSTDSLSRYRLKYNQPMQETDSASNAECSAQRTQVVS